LQAFDVISIPPKMRIPIRDREKDHTPAEAEAIRIEYQSLYNTLAREQTAFDKLQSKDPALFTDLPIDPTILEMEATFQVKQNPLSQVLIRGDSEEPEQAYSDVGREEVNKGEDGMELCSSPPRSVATIDSIAENADFISLE
jgi:hypothetical protein